MKLRIAGQSLRVRISEEELETLRGERLLEQRTTFPNGAVFRVSLEVAEVTRGREEDDRIGVTWWGEQVLIRLSTDVAETLKKQGPARDNGITVEIPTKDGKPLRVSLQLDLAARAGK